jgi:mono/diheme cytochrome c family protein
MIVAFTAAIALAAFVGVHRLSGAVEKIPPDPPAAHVAAKTPEEAGRYIVMTSGCNDCHTPMYDQRHGQVPELEWLKGSALGWYGPWGTTYASNLRLMVSQMPIEAWVKMLHERHDRPPMPWTSVNAMSETDTRAMYAFIKSLGNAGEKMPEPLAPGKEPQGTYLLLFPQSPKEK